MATRAEFRASSGTLALLLRVQRVVKTILYHVAVCGFGLLMLYPILWMFSSSVKPTTEIWTTVNNLIPSQIVLQNYVDGWKGFGGISFATFYQNTFFLTITRTVFQILSSTVIAYGFARIKFRGRQFWFSIMLMTLMLPAEVMRVPQYIIFNQLGWVPGFLPLIVPALGGGAFFIFMIMQFIRGIPVDMDEAAMIDGAGQYEIFRYVIMPQLTPALVTATIFAFYWSYEDFMGPLIYLTRPETYTVSIALRNYADVTSGTNWGAIFSMLSLSLLPVFVLFVLFQPFIVEGIATTGLKG